MNQRVQDAAAENSTAVDHTTAEDARAEDGTAEFLKKRVDAAAESLDTHITMDATVER
jgi:hypothetical protein